MPFTDIVLTADGGALPVIVAEHRATLLNNQSQNELMVEVLVDQSENPQDIPDGTGQLNCQNLSRNYIPSNQNNYDMYLQ